MKKALVVGINYVGTHQELRGCVNDANSMTAMLQSQGFIVEKMLDSAATTDGIKAGLARLTNGAQPGDVILFHYSGHGSQLPSSAEPDGFEEIICPIDLDWATRLITDADLKNIFNSVPNGVNTTVVLDCCHSGTGMDQVESYTPAAPVPMRELVHLDETSSPDKSRFMPPPADIITKLENRVLVNWQTSRDVNAGAMLIAGCQANQTSADAFLNGTYQGAATASILAAFSKNPHITYKNLIEEMTGFMIMHGFSQRPELGGFHGLHDQQFLLPWGSNTAQQTTVPVAQVSREVNKREMSRSRSVFIGVAFLFALAAAFFLK